MNEYASGGIGEDANTSEIRDACSALYARQLIRGDGAWDPVSDLETTVATMLSMSGFEPRFDLLIAKHLSRMIKTKREIGSLTEEVLHEFVSSVVAKRMMVYVKDVKFFYEFVDKKIAKNRTNSPEV